jgi:hypothetical protein
MSFCSTNRPYLLTEASLLNKSSRLAAALGVTKFTAVIVTHLVTPCLT